MLLGAAVLISPAACTANRHRLIAKAIGEGADPIAVKCALDSMNGSSPVCIAKAVSGH